MPINLANWVDTQYTSTYTTKHKHVTNATSWTHGTDGEESTAFVPNGLNSSGRKNNVAPDFGGGVVKDVASFKAFQLASVTLESRALIEPVNVTIRHAYLGTIER